jgi:dTDP-4-amino-4,6-dideoxygalactose transaminase
VGAGGYSCAVAPLRFQRPTLPAADAIEGYLRLAREARWFSNFGPCGELLRSRLSDAAGRPNTLVANATIGLIVGIAACARDRSELAGKEALVPSFAFAASAQAAVWNDLRPVFVDVSPKHWHLDPDALAHALSERRDRVATVIALSSFGVPPPPEVRQAWERTCADAGVPLIVDSAAGFGAVAADGVPIGGQGDIEVVSFHALKPLSSGEGGAIFARDEALAAEVNALVNFTFDDNHQALRADGLNAKMSEPTAAIGLAGLDGLEEAILARRRHAQTIVNRLPDGFECQHGSERGTWQFVPVAAPTREIRDAVLAEGRANGVPLRTYYDPLHRMPAFRDYEAADDLAVTEDLADRMISLPMAVDLDESEIDAIVGLVGSATSAIPARD